MAPGARELPLLREIEEDDAGLFTEIAHAIREDGAWIDAGENDGAIVQRLAKNPEALGVFGFSFLIQNEDRIRGARVGGVAPAFEAIAAGDYSISRSLYVYLKKAHLGVIEGLGEFITAFTDERAWGEEGYLIDKGLIPLPEAQRASMAASARAFQVMTERPK
jgi:phosphate transport system substrate-binding protein